MWKKESLGALAGAAEAEDISMLHEHDNNPHRFSKRVEDIHVGSRHRKDLGDIKGLARSISEVGLLHPVVVTPDGELIAGARRLAACKHLGWEDVPVTVVPLDEIVRGEASENAFRKDFLPTEVHAITKALEDVERAAAQERMTLGKVSTGSETGKTRDKIGAYAGVSGKQVDKISAVMEAAKENPKEFGDLPALMDKGGKVNGAYKKVRRKEKEKELADKIASEAERLGEKQYGVILADPPWRFEPYSRETGMDLAADNHYPTSPTDEICKLDVASAAAKDCVLFLWATSPMLPDALKVLEAWGFKYVTSMVWVKDKAGTGYWVRNKHELILIGRHGEIVPPPDPKPESVITAARRKHSQKPDELYEIIEAAWPELPKLEMNARQRRAGWDAWGAES